MARYLTDEELTASYEVRRRSGPKDSAEEGYILNGKFLTATEARRYALNHPGMRFRKAVRRADGKIIVNEAVKAILT